MAVNVTDALHGYFQRINPTLRRPEEGADRFGSIDVYKSWDGLSRQLFGTAPAALDRTRATRNRFVHVVK